MEFFEVLKSRRSVRLFMEKEVEQEKLNKILEAANSAPSAGDLQAYEIFVVKDQKKKALLRAAGGQDFVAKAPVVLVFVANPRRSAGKYGERGARLYCLLDAAIATAYAQLAAADLGLGSTWVGAFDDDEVREVIGVSGDMVPVALLPIGYPTEKPSPTPRRKIRDLVHEV